MDPPVAPETPSPRPVSAFTGPIGELMGQGVLTPPSRPGLLAEIDRYQILRLLGGGGMGIALLARDFETGRQVAIKFIKPELAADQRLVHRFMKEARHLERLKHENIVPILATVSRPEGPYFVMPYFERGSLAKLIRPGEPLEGELALDIALQVAQALEFAHQGGIIHRDLKPANVLLTESGKACLADFGLARSVYNDSIVEADQRRCEGTAPYMSPALAAGESEDTRCDIYAFGALVYEMLTGEQPYTGQTTNEIRQKILHGAPRQVLSLNPKADAGLAAVAEDAMARQLRDRYATMSDVVADLKRIKEGQVPVGPRGRARKIRYALRRVRLSISVTRSVTVLTIAGLLGFFFWLRQHATLADSTPLLSGPIPRISEVLISGSPDDYTVTVNGTGFGSLQEKLPFLGLTGAFCIGDAAQYGHAEWGYLGDASDHKLKYESWSDTRIRVSGLRGNPGDALILALWNPASRRGVTWGGNLSGATGMPHIESVQFTGAGKSLRIAIRGAGFGGAPASMPRTGTLSHFVFADYRARASKGSSLFTAGATQWHAPTSLGTRRPDSVTLNYKSWSDSEIIVEGFSGTYGQANAEVRSGDPVTIIVWNSIDADWTGPQTAWGGVVP